MYYKCQKCGCSLDPGEKCACGGYGKNYSYKNRSPYKRNTPRKSTTGVIPLRGSDVFAITAPLIEKLSRKDF